MFTREHGNLLEPLVDFLDTEFLYKIKQSSFFTQNLPPCVSNCKTNDRYLREVSDSTIVVEIGGARVEEEGESDVCLKERWRRSGSTVHPSHSVVRPIRLTELLYDKLFSLCRDLDF